MVKLIVREDLPGEGKYTPELPWTGAGEEVIEIRRDSPEHMARALRHEVRHARYLRRKDLVFSSVKERKAKEEIASALLDYLRNRDEGELRSSLSYYQEQFGLSDRTFVRYLKEVAGELDRWL